MFTPFDLLYLLLLLFLLLLFLFPSGALVFS